eukprot:3961982-Pleurochrysis_carterae.AAC.1
MPAVTAAGMLAGAGEAQAETEAVARALSAAARRDTARSGVSAGAPGALATAGRACAAALRALLDSLSAEGAMIVAREARAFRAEAGLTAGAAMRGGFAAGVLRARAAAASPRGAAATATGSPAGRTSAPSTTLTTVVDESPRAKLIRQLLAEKAAEAAASGGGGLGSGGSTGQRGGETQSARHPEGRRLHFEDEAGAQAEAGGRRQRENEGALMPPPAQRRRTGLAAFAALRPAGAETMPAAEFVRALEAAMDGV